MQKKNSSKLTIKQLLLGKLGFIFLLGKNSKQSSTPLMGPQIKSTAVDKSQSVTIEMPEVSTTAEQFLKELQRACSLNVTVTRRLCEQIKLWAVEAKIGEVNKLYEQLCFFANARLRDKENPASPGFILSYDSLKSDLVSVLSLRGKQEE